MTLDATSEEAPSDQLLRRNDYDGLALNDVSADSIAGTPGPASAAVTR